MRAASISERGDERKKARIQNVPNETDCPICGRISAQYVFSEPDALEVVVERDHGRLVREDDPEQEQRRRRTRSPRKRIVPNA